MRRAGLVKPLGTLMSAPKIRNVAIIAHVDHGKTTLVDQLLKQSGAYAAHQAVVERALDRNDLEKERGITILAKVASVVWNDVRINIVDTPGHADFGGEVERILNMVDGAVILVDAAEPVLPQTKFVLGKALARGLKPIVVVNKIDRGDARPDDVHNEMFDLFAALDANEEQLDFPMLFASGRQGWAVANLDDPRESLSPLFELILSHVKAPNLDAEAPFGMVASILESDTFLGRVLTGRVEQGRAMHLSAQSDGLDGRGVYPCRTRFVQHVFQGCTRSFPPALGRLLGPAWMRALQRQGVRGAGPHAAVAVQQERLDAGRTQIDTDKHAFLLRSGWNRARATGINARRRDGRCQGAFKRQAPCSWKNRRIDNVFQPFLLTALMLGIELELDGLLAQGGQRMATGQN